MCTSNLRDCSDIVMPKCRKLDGETAQPLDKSSIKRMSTISSSRSTCLNFWRNATRSNWGVRPRGDGEDGAEVCFLRSIAHLVMECTLPFIQRPYIRTIVITCCCIAHKSDWRRIHYCTSLTSLVMIPPTHRLLPQCAHVVVGNTKLAIYQAR